MNCPHCNGRATLFATELGIRWYCCGKCHRTFTPKVGA